MNNLGKEIILKGISQKGKNKIKINGEKWIVFAKTDTILFSPNDKGPWIFISPINKTHTDKASMWIKLNNDENFVIL
jgi:hypothetical protein